MYITTEQPVLNLVSRYNDVARDQQLPIDIQFFFLTATGYCAYGYTYTVIEMYL